MLLGTLINSCLKNRDNNALFGRTDCMRFYEWACEMTASGRGTPAVREAAEHEPDMTEPLRTRELFGRVVRELTGDDEITADTAYRVRAEEYRQGAFDSACEFLDCSPCTADRLGFPYTLCYDPITDSYFVSERPDLKDAQLEEYARGFLEDNGLYKQEMTV